MNNQTTPVIAIVIPCYNEEKALPETIPTILNILNRLIEAKEISNRSFIFCVDDTSKDETWNVICKLHEQNPMIKGMTLAHNRGHQYALLSGLMEVRDKCDAAISIDADLQDEPEAMVKMISLFKGGADIVYGVRNSRETDTWFKRNSARGFYKLQALMGLETIYDHADYRLMSAMSLDILSEYKEQNLFLRGIVPQIGLSSAIVYYNRNPRVAGESKYPLKKMISFSIDGITSFSSKPIRWIFLIGVILLVLDILVAFYVLISYFCGVTVSGWSSIMLSVWFIGSLTLISLGIVGEYIGKIFIETKKRPRYNIRERIK